MSNLDHITPDDVMAATRLNTPDALDWLAQWVKLRLSSPQAAPLWESHRDEGLGTGYVLSLLGMLGLSDDDSRKFKRALSKLRSTGRLGGYWSPHPTRVYMGYPVVVWHLPGLVPAVCKPPALKPLPEMF
jgi:hypothetical protein